MSGSGRPRFLITEQALFDSPLGQILANRLPVREVRPSISPSDYENLPPEALVLAEHRGRFVKPCPGTKGYNCCGLTILHLGLGCHLDCSYCILQGYLTTRALVLFGNLEQALAEIRSTVAEQGSLKRFCTGEFTDSLLLEEQTGLGARLVRLFALTRDAVLELKTKTTNIDGLLDLDHRGRTIISFSVNAPAVCRSEEPRAAPLDKRLAAAGRAARAGYRVGFHFDPIIHHPGWEKGYAQAAARIFTHVPADKIAWISLGCFRYLPGLKKLIRRRHPRSRILDEEFVLAPDGKMRYIRPLRVEMYSRLLEAVRRADPEVCVYMCMESPRVWREVFGYDPGTKGLTEMLDQRV